MYSIGPSPVSLQEPSSLKPPSKVQLLAPSRPYPCGVLTVKLRMPGERFAIQEVVQGDYMAWSIAEALAMSFKKLKALVNVKNIFMCDEIEIREVHTPSMAGYLWQFCEFRFDYQALRVDRLEKRCGVHRWCKRAWSYCRRLCRSISAPKEAFS